MRANRGKQQYYNKQASKSDILTLLALSIIDAKLALFNQNSNTQIFVTKFFQMALFDSWAIWYVFASCEKVGDM